MSIGTADVDNLSIATRATATSAAAANASAGVSVDDQVGSIVSDEVSKFQTLSDPKATGAGVEITQGLLQHQIDLGNAPNATQEQKDIAAAVSAKMPKGEAKNYGQLQGAVSAYQTAAGLTKSDGSSAADGKVGQQTYASLLGADKGDWQYGGTPATHTTQTKDGALAAAASISKLKAGAVGGAATPAVAPTSQTDAVKKQQASSDFEQKTDAATDKKVELNPTAQPVAASNLPKYSPSQLAALNAMGVNLDAAARMQVSPSGSGAAASSGGRAALTRAGASTGGARSSMGVVKVDPNNPPGFQGQLLASNATGDEKTEAAKAISQGAFHVNAILAKGLRHTLMNADVLTASVPQPSYMGGGMTQVGTSSLSHALGANPPESITLNLYSGNVDGRTTGLVGAVQVPTTMLAQASTNDQVAQALAQQIAAAATH